MLAEGDLEDYGGSRALLPLCQIFKLEIDQVNFIACQLVALCLSFLLRAEVQGPNRRLVFTLVSGLFISIFCFGWETFHIVGSASAAYTIMIIMADTWLMPWTVLFVCMGHLSFLHARRQFWETSTVSIDITGPVMVLTEKLTSLAFSVRDKEEGTELQKKHALGRRPPLLDFAAFSLQFQTLLAGPFVFFDDFACYIYTPRAPSPMKEVGRKVGASVFFAFCYTAIGPRFPISSLRETWWLHDTSVLYKLWYLTWATTLERCKYYHAWTLADAVCNAGGLGWDPATGKWDAVTNVDPYGFEFGTSLKESLDAWNKGTGRWLRHVAYERAPVASRTLITYMLSALWHGFAPGYYITFLSGALFTAAARVVRRHIRPLFASQRRVYDFLTWAATRFVISYVTFTFILLDFFPSIQVFRKLYFSCHVLGVVVLLTLPSIGPFLQAKRKVVESAVLPPPPLNLLTKKSKSETTELGPIPHPDIKKFLSTASLQGANLKTG